MSEYEHDPQSRHDEATRQNQEGRALDQLENRAGLAGNQAPGRVPPKIDMLNRWDRKQFRKDDFLLTSLIRDAFKGLCLLIVGAGTLGFGFYKPFNWKVVAAGAGISLLGLWSLWLALRAWRKMQAIALRKS